MILIKIRANDPDRLKRGRSTCLQCYKIADADAFMALDDAAGEPYESCPRCSSARIMILIPDRVDPNRQHTIRDRRKPIYR